MKILLQVIDMPISANNIKPKDKDVNIISFDKSSFIINRSLIQSLKRPKRWKKHCYRCRRNPDVIGEIWGKSESSVDIDRVYCPKCSEHIEKLIKKAQNEN